VAHLPDLFDDTTLYTASDRLVADSGGMVEFKFSVTGVSDTAALDQLAQAQADVNKLYVSLNVTKTVTDASGIVLSSAKVKDTASSLLDIAIKTPDALTGRIFDTIYRIHDGSNTITDTANTDGEHFVQDARYTVITSDKFSDYSLAQTVYNLAVSSGTGGSTTGNTSGTYTQGDSITITATPNANYYFANWSASGITLDSNSANPTSFVMPKGNVSVQANFTTNYYIITSKVDTTGGTITPLGDTSVAQGSTQEFIITPDATYRIKDIIVDGVSTGISGKVGVSGTYTFENVLQNHTISALFELDDGTSSGNDTAQGTKTDVPKTGDGSSALIIMIAGIALAGLTLLSVGYMRQRKIAKRKTHRHKSHS
jgi:LPXTG-motif cell wall-anchored protein